ncbi:hypothetical protein M431DRAFT_80285, partial [Trichoderma harzianum CBS 226.95]
KKKQKKAKTYNSRCSLMVTHSTTNLPVSGLSMGEQTGPRIFHYLWSYVLVSVTDWIIAITCGRLHYFVFELKQLHIRRNFVR